MPASFIEKVAAAEPRVCCICKRLLLTNGYSDPYQTLCLFSFTFTACLFGNVRGPSASSRHKGSVASSEMPQAEGRKTQILHSSGRRPALEWMDSGSVKAIQTQGFGGKDVLQRLLIFRAKGTF